jgi:phage tail sheath protein FI
VTEHLSPGASVEESGNNPKFIEKVSTGVAGFVGLTHSKPGGDARIPLASFADFERAYGGLEPVTFAGGAARTQPNFIAHAARDFFSNGGQKLYISRVSRPDGKLPTADDYAGGSAHGRKTGLAAFEDVEEISIVAAPGSSYRAAVGAADKGQRATEIARRLIAHAEKMRHRFAILDAPSGCSPSDALAYREQLNSSRAALYYPWITTNEAGVDVQHKISLPPSGFLAGVFARVDAVRGVWKAPANEIVKDAVELELMLSQPQLETLNAQNVNCLRGNSPASGQGILVWGARTLASDPEWKYVNVRRYVSYLEHSVERGTHWAAFEPNGEPLWANVRGNVANFLLNEWRAGALQGAKPEEAFFVRCDRTTMTQNDLDNGRLVCLIGVAPVKPAEFVIIRIGQWTASRHKP